MHWWTILAGFLLIGFCFLAGAGGALLAVWAMHLRTYTLEYAVADLQRKVIREVKMRAGEERQRGRRAEEEILEAASDAERVPVAQAETWVQRLLRTGKPPDA